MALIRVVVDLEAQGDLTNSVMDEVRDKVQKYADSVVGVQYLADKQGDTESWVHKHESSEDYACQTCRDHAHDELS